ncbi:MAG TPA: sporulation protein YabP [Firmicutes bacterium]|jgi:sporulation protein YabP|nr:sporulation protein YabP [Bacillota bacterium]HBK67325.1 sporulation protein YabP [Bacillota bacterium]
MEERLTNRGSHQLTLASREKLTMDGVTNVGSYDQDELILETDQGVLEIKGEKIHLTQLNLDQGKISLTGRIDSLIYRGESLAQKNRGFFGKIFK